MAKIDYYGIQTQIKTQLTNSLGTLVLSNTNVGIEIEPIDDPDSQDPWIGIYLDEAPIKTTFLGIGGPQQHIINPTFILEVFTFDINEFRNAAERRDDLVGDVKETLMLDRTLGGKVVVSHLTGIKFDRARMDDESGFFAGAEITYVTEVRG
jgi:hypothetical protein